MFSIENNDPGMCSSHEELVAFLYGESDDAARVLTEQHLAACDECAGEFADLSFARLDVYEWHRDEFVEMATPWIVIPYAETAGRASWLEAFRGLFASTGQWATAGAAFAAVALVVAGVWMLGSKPLEVADVNSATVDVKEIDRAIPASTPDASVAKPESPETEVLPQRASTSPLKRQPQPAKTHANAPASARPVRQPVPPKQQVAPRLNDFEDEDDTTLRLGDLLAEVDTRD